MRILFSFLILLSSSFSFAAAPNRDSVAVFHRAEKVIVLVNESGRVTGQSRLQKMMEVFGGADDILFYNADRSIKINCGRSQTAVSCTFSFLPSSSVLLGERKMDAVSTLSELQASAVSDLSISFESSQQDRFMLSIVGGDVRFHAEKKILKP